MCIPFFRLPSWSRGGASTDMVTGTLSVVASRRSSSSSSSSSISTMEAATSASLHCCVSLEMSTLVREVVAAISTERSVSSGRWTGCPASNSFLRLNVVAVGRLVTSIPSLCDELTAAAGDWLTWLDKLAERTTEAVERSAEAVGVGSAELWVLNMNIMCSMGRLEIG